MYAKKRLDVAERQHANTADVWTCGGLCAVFALTSGETFRKVKSSAAGAENHLPLRDFFAAAPSEAVAVAKNLGGCTLELPYPVASS